MKHLIGLLLTFAASAWATGDSPVQWQPWRDDAFAAAKRENKLVILYLEAVWCHWCHVMDQETYRNPKVAELIQKKYVPLRVDQDSRPDLSVRYEEYGWPATILFDGDGKELAKRRGFIPPDQMAALLQAFIDDPTPGPSVTAEQPWKVPTTAALTPELEKKLESYHSSSWDSKNGGWGGDHKYLDWDTVEYALGKNDPHARETLKLQKKLIDPVWGGVYQYSAGGTWNEPHFEKLIRFQAENLRIFSLAYARWGEKAHRESADAVLKYVTNFLTDPSGAFYVSQDADLKKGEHSAGYFKLNDQARRKKGMPVIDRNLYTRENGWMIHGLTAYYAATQDAKALAMARKSAAWIEANRALPGGGFRHGEKDTGGPFLDDTLSMGRAYLALYSASGERAWLDKAQQAMGYLSQGFVFEKDGKKVGYLSSKVGAGLITARPNRDENIRLARFGNLLNYYTGKKEHREVAENALRFLVTPEIADAPGPQGILLANDEIRRQPIHLTVVGPKADATAQELFAEATRYPSGYLRTEWWDKNEGRLPNQDVTYPDLPKAAAFVCTGQRCSLPIFTPKDLRPKVDKLLGTI